MTACSPKVGCRPRLAGPSEGSFVMRDPERTFPSANFARSIDGHRMFFGDLLQRWPHLQIGRPTEPQGACPHWASLPGPAQGQRCSVLPASGTSDAKQSHTESFKLFPLNLRPRGTTVGLLRHYLCDNHATEQCRQHWQAHQPSLPQQQLVKDATETRVLSPGCTTLGSLARPVLPPS